jgi:trans-2,3-dihydro-3-hydroxyanthranilate isomerase
VTVDFLQVDVFARGPYSGNPLAVFVEAGRLTTAQMQQIAHEMNLSESAFVTWVDGERYRVRIFTPYQELPFAGHPTLGTAWTLRHLGKLTGSRFVQTTTAGETQVSANGDDLWFERTGRAYSDLELDDPVADGSVAAALGLEARDVGLEARELGRSGRLRPAVADAGLAQLMVPLRDETTLARCSPRADMLGAVHPVGVYCFTAMGAGRLAARGFFPAAGVSEDPATGSAAAGLGLYLGDRLGGGSFEVEQGREMGRPSRILMHCQPGTVSVGGRCELVLTGRLEVLPA